MTQEIQGEEIQRQQNLEDGQDGVQSLAVTLKLQQMNERVNMLSHKLNEVQAENTMLKEEKEQTAKTSYETTKSLQDEIEKILEREAALKATYTLLEEGLAEQKGANLDGANKEGQKNLQIERNLILEERVSKAEADAEKMRGERLIAVEELKAVKQKLVECEFKISQLTMELTNANNNLANNKVPLKQLEELNDENQALSLERNELRQKLTENQNTENQISEAEAQQRFQDLKTEMIKLKDAYMELKKSQDASGVQQPPAANSAKNILSVLYAALVKARMLFLLLESSVKTDSQNDDQIQHLGKRQRTE